MEIVVIAVVSIVVVGFVLSRMNRKMYPQGNRTIEVNGKERQLPSWF